MVKVLIADPNPSFAAMIKQVLEETGRFRCTGASTGAEAIGLASRDPHDIVILESSLEDFSLRDAVTVLRRSQPQLPIMIILPMGEQPLPDAAKYFDVQGILSKPLYIPQLQSEIEAALQRPVNGITPSPRSVAPAQPAAPPEAAPPPKKAAPRWLDDVNRAAQYLTALTLESSAEAALLMRGRQLIAFAGQSSKDEADELAGLIAASWAKDTSAGNTSGAQVRFIRLNSGADYLVYSSLAAEDVVLSMAFQAETPLGQIRKQAKRATEALLTEPQPQTLNPKPQTPNPAPEPAQSQPPITALELDQAELLTPLPPTPGGVRYPTLAELDSDLEFEAFNTRSDTRHPSPDTATANPELETLNLQPETSNLQPETITPDEIPAEIDWGAFPLKDPTHLPPGSDWVPLAGAGAAAEPDLTTLFAPDAPTAPPTLNLDSLFALPETETEIETAAEPETPNPKPETPNPIPDSESLTELSRAILQLERNTLAHQPPLLDLPPAGLPDVRRTSHSLYDLSYTLLILPRLATNLLIGDLKARLEQWLILLAEAYDWNAEAILIEPGHVEISVRAAPTESVDSIARTLLNETSDRILTEFPRLAAEHAKRPGAFWSPAYYAVTPGRRLTPDEIHAFTEYQRREQTGGKY